MRMCGGWNCRLGTSLDQSHFVPGAHRHVSKAAYHSHAQAFNVKLATVDTEGAAPEEMQLSGEDR